MHPYVHTLTIVRTPRDISDLDEYGQPTAGTVVEVPVAGLLQPQTAREVDDTRSGGVPLADVVIFLPVGTDVLERDAVLKDGERYEVTGVRRFDFGGLAHLEVDARRIGALELEEVGS